MRLLWLHFLFLRLVTSSLFFIKFQRSYPSIDVLLSPSSPTFLVPRPGGAPWRSSAGSDAGICLRKWFRFFAALMLRMPNSSAGQILQHSETNALSMLPLKGIYNRMLD